MAEKTLRISDLIGAIDKIAPFRLAESWDNVGLQIGRSDRPAGRILVALEISPEVIEEIKHLEINTLVTHHPLIFSPLKSLNETSPIAAWCCELVRLGVNLIAAHTNLDSVAEGTNGEIADRLGLENRRFLLPNAPTNESVKFVVFVPEPHANAVIEAAVNAGAGTIGDYSHCSFRSPGTGTYKPLEGAKPFAGTVGQLEEAEDEVRLEIVCPRGRIGRLIEAVKRVHPYEEVAFDVYPLEPNGEATTGLGLVGELVEECDLRQFVDQCKKAFEIQVVGLVGEETRKINRVAICSGAGGEAVRRWRPGTADVLVTGEMTHHQCAEARDRGFAVVLVGHYASEVIVADRLARMIREHPLLAEYAPDVLVSRQEIDPLRRV